MLDFRKARQADSTDLTLCMDAAARGLSAWGWSNFSHKGQSAFEFGRERIRTDESSKLYFKNWVVCELNNNLIGAFLGFTVDDPYPEIDFDKIDSLRGMDITITTSARTNEEARALLTSFKLPIKS